MMSAGGLIRLARTCTEYWTWLLARVHWQSSYSCVVKGVMCQAVDAVVAAAADDDDMMTTRTTMLQSLAAEHAVDTAAAVERRRLRDGVEPLVRLVDSAACVFGTMGSTISLTKPVQQAPHTLAAALAGVLQADAQGYLGICADVARVGQSLRQQWQKGGVGADNLAVQRATHAVRLPNERGPLSHHCAKSMTCQEASMANS